MKNQNKIAKPFSLSDKTIEEIQQMAINIASETFIKFGNKAVSFTDNNDLRNLMGGRWSSYPVLSKIVIDSYNEKLADLILSNL